MEEDILRESEEKYRLVFKNIPMGILHFDRSGIITACNEHLVKIIGSSEEALLGLNMLNLPDENVVLAVKQALGGELSQYEGEYHSVTADKMINIKAIFSPIVLEDRTVAGGVGIVEDITHRKRVEEELHIQKVYFQQLFESSPDAIVMLDNRDRVMDINKGFKKLFQYEIEEIKDRNINELIIPEYLSEEGVAFSNAVLGGANVQRETVRMRKDGSLVNVAVLGYPIKVNGNQKGIYAIFSDITDRKKAEEQLKYLSLHDSLTGLYNRTYFEQELRRIEAGRYGTVGIIICDVDGLKLINDTLGHDSGDTLLVAAAGIFKNSFRKGDMVARIGGDEFSILLPNSQKQLVESVCQRIRHAVARYNLTNPKIPMSISIGFAVGENVTDLGDLFKAADNNMYREKLHRSKSARSAIVQTLMKALEARDFITEGHGERLQELVVDLAVETGLSERKMADLRLLAQFHDIGKVGIPDRILFKPEMLDPEEITEMERHSEIGYRIAQSAPDLVPIADWILKHHEWWNGNGYPFGIKGEEIPLECRILAIADAYDAMTSDRPYRKALTHEEAVEELRRCAGTQFDPNLVERFIKVVER